MKNFIFTLCERLDRIGKDKYQHFASGVVLGAVVLISGAWCGAWLWLSLLLSGTAVFVAALYKERIDSRQDTGDLVATVLGGAVVWCIAITLFLTA